MSKILETSDDRKIVGFQLNNMIESPKYWTWKELGILCFTENYEKIFYLKNKESINIYCTKHSEYECVQKLKYQQHNGGGTKNKFKITKGEKIKE